jgi:hypothetical protein
MARATGKLRKILKWFGYGFLVLVAVIIINAIINPRQTLAQNFDDQFTADNVKPGTAAGGWMDSPSAPRTEAEERAYVAEHEANENARLAKDVAWATTYAKALRSTMRNPASFELNQVLVMQDNSICFTYRAQNGFGGMNVGQAVLSPHLKFKTEEQDGFLSFWTRYCKNKAGLDEIRNIKMFM